MLRAYRASQPRVTQLWKVAIIPLVVVVLSLSGLVRRYPATAETIGVWLAALICGALAGHLIMRRLVVRADHARKLLWRPGDWISMVLIPLIFAVRYLFAYLAAVAPERHAQPGFYLSEIGASGLILGVFVGRLVTTLVKYGARTVRVALGRISQTTTRNAACRSPSTSTPTPVR